MRATTAKTPPASWTPRSRSWWRPRAENCHKLLQENINLLHALAKALLDRETITGDDIDLLVKGEPLPPFDADGSAAKQEPAAPAPASADAGG